MAIGNNNPTTQYNKYGDTETFDRNFAYYQLLMPTYFTLHISTKILD